MITSNLVALDNYLPSLLSLDIYEVSFVIDRLFPELLEADDTIRYQRLHKRVFNFIHRSDDGQSNKLKMTNIQSINGFKAKLILNKIALKVRDIPMTLLSLDFLHFESNMLNLNLVGIK